MLITDTLQERCHTVVLPSGFSVGDAPMKARQLLSGASFAPDQLRVIFQAFDAAWAATAAEVGENPQAIEAARLKLANVLLMLARNGNVDDPERLKNAALQLLSARSGR